MTLRLFYVVISENLDSKIYPKKLLGCDERRSAIVVSILKGRTSEWYIARKCLIHATAMTSVSRHISSLIGWLIRCSESRDRRLYKWGNVRLTDYTLPWNLPISAGYFLPSARHWLSAPGIVCLLTTRFLARPQYECRPRFFRWSTHAIQLF